MQKRWEPNTWKKRLGRQLACIVCSQPFGVWLWDKRARKAVRPTPARKLQEGAYIHAECVGRARIV